MTHLMYYEPTHQQIDKPTYRWADIASYRLSYRAASPRPKTKRRFSVDIQS